MGDSLNTLFDDILALILDTITAFLVDLVAGLFQTGNGGGLLG